MAAGWPQLGLLAAVMLVSSVAALEQRTELAQMRADPVDPKEFVDPNAPLVASKKDVANINASAIAANSGKKSNESADNVSADEPWMSNIPYMRLTTPETDQLNMQLEKNIHLLKLNQKLRSDNVDMRVKKCFPHFSPSFGAFYATTRAPGLAKTAKDLDGDANETAVEADDGEAKEPSSEESMARFLQEDDDSNMTAGNSSDMDADVNGTSNSTDSTMDNENESGDSAPAGDDGSAADDDKPLPAAEVPSADELDDSSAQRVAADNTTARGKASAAKNITSAGNSSNSTNATNEDDESEEFDSDADTSVQEPPPMNFDGHHTVTAGAVTGGAFMPVDGVKLAEWKSESGKYVEAPGHGSFGKVLRSDAYLAGDGKVSINLALPACKGSNMAVQFGGYNYIGLDAGELWEIQKTSYVGPTVILRSSHGSEIRYTTLAKAKAKCVAMPECTSVARLGSQNYRVRRGKVELQYCNNPYYNTNCLHNWWYRYRNRYGACHSSYRPYTRQIACPHKKAYLKHAMFVQGPAFRTSANGPLCGFQYKSLGAKNAETKLNIDNVAPTWRNKEVEYDNIADAKAWCGKSVNCTLVRRRASGKYVCRGGPVLPASSGEGYNKTRVCKPFHHRWIEKHPYDWGVVPGKMFTLSIERTGPFLTVKIAGQQLYKIYNPVKKPSMGQIAIQPTTSRVRVFDMKSVMLCPKNDSGVECSSPGHGKSFCNQTSAQCVCDGPIYGGDKCEIGTNTTHYGNSTQYEPYCNKDCQAAAKMCVNKCFHENEPYLKEYRACRSTCNHTARCPFNNSYDEQVPNKLGAKLVGGKALYFKTKHMAAAYCNEAEENGTECNSVAYMRLGANWTVRSGPLEDNEHARSYPKVKPERAQCVQLCNQGCTADRYEGCKHKCFNTAGINDAVMLFALNNNGTIDENQTCFNEKVEDKDYRICFNDTVAEDLSKGEGLDKVYNYGGGISSTRVRIKKVEQENLEIFRENVWWKTENKRLRAINNRCPKPCPANATNYTCSSPGHGTSFCNDTSGKCQCDFGYHGPSCQIHCPRNASGAICSSPTGNYSGNFSAEAHHVKGEHITEGWHGNCSTVSGECQCTGEWEGPACEIPTINPCPRGWFSKQCSGNGLCQKNGTCACEYSFHGAACEVECPKDSKGKVGRYANGSKHDGAVCSDHGVCNTELGTCKCEDEFCGKSCNMTGESQCFNCPKDLDGQICHLHGECKSEKCICDEYYHGYACNITCPKGPDGIPCSDHGNCNETTGVCECDLDNGDKANNATVHEQNTWKYYGDACEKTCPRNTKDTFSCSHHGYCNTTVSSCDCEEDYYGSACQHKVVACPVGYNGEQCSGPLAGTCNKTIGGLCQCNYGFYGPNCDSRCPTWPPHNKTTEQPNATNGYKFCAGREHGTCNTTTSDDEEAAEEVFCACSPYWSSTACEKPNYGCPMDEQDRVCHNRGNCTSNGTCSCDEGWIGNACHIKCPHGPNKFGCSRHGECALEYEHTGNKTRKLMDPSDLDVGTAICKCQDGWTGTHCGVSLCADGPHNCAECVNVKIHMKDGDKMSGSMICGYAGGRNATCMLGNEKGPIDEWGGQLSTKAGAKGFVDSWSFGYCVEPACADHTDCASCAANPVCGWCKSETDPLKQCMPGTKNGPSGFTCAKFMYGTCAPPPPKLDLWGFFLREKAKEAEREARKELLEAEKSSLTGGAEGVVNTTALMLNITGKFKNRTSASAREDLHRLGLDRGMTDVMNAKLKDMAPPGQNVSNFSIGDEGSNVTNVTARKGGANASAPGNNTAPKVTFEVPKMKVAMSEELFAQDKTRFTADLAALLKIPAEDLVVSLVENQAKAAATALLQEQQDDSTGIMNRMFSFLQATDAADDDGSFVFLKIVIKGDHATDAAATLSGLVDAKSDKLGKMGITPSSVKVERIEPKGSSKRKAAKSANSTVDKHYGCEENTDCATCTGDEHCGWCMGENKCKDVNAKGAPASHEGGCLKFYKTDCEDQTGSYPYPKGWNVTSANLKKGTTKTMLPARKGMKKKGPKGNDTNSSNGSNSTKPKLTYKGLAGPGLPANVTIEKHPILHSHPAYNDDEEDEAEAAALDKAQITDGAHYDDPLRPKTERYGVLSKGGVICDLNGCWDASNKEMIHERMDSPRPVVL